MPTRVLIAVAALLGIAVTASLGSWQWSRGQQRTELHLSLIHI